MATPLISLAEIREGSTSDHEIRSPGNHIASRWDIYKKLAGLSGTAKSQARPFKAGYGLDVSVVPTRRPCNRVDFDDEIHASDDAKKEAIVEDIFHYSHDLGRPVLVGTTTIRECDEISKLLAESFQLDHHVLDAQPSNLEREAEIIAAAGQQLPRHSGTTDIVGAVTIATTMAGKGTEIKLGPDVVYDKCKVPSREAASCRTCLWHLGLRHRLIMI